MSLKDAIEQNDIIILPPMDVFDSVALVEKSGIHCTATILDPWYNSGVGGTIPLDEYDAFIYELLRCSGELSDVLYLWGFPEIVGEYVRRPPEGFTATWLTWYYKNCPSVIRGWRSSQQACIQYKRKEARLHPENFLEGEKLERYKSGKMRFVPGPSSVIEVPLVIGFVGKKEQQGHPAQKAEAVIAPLLLMSSCPRDIVFDPMAGSGTTAAVARRLGRKCIVCDKEEEYIQMMERRLGVERTKIC